MASPLRQITVHDPNIAVLEFTLELWDTFDATVLYTFVPSLDRYFKVEPDPKRKLSIVERAQTLYETYLKGQIDSIVFKVNEPCVNITTPGASGYTQLVSEKGLVYCLTDEDIEYVNTYERNPYTGRQLILDNHAPLYPDIGKACVDSPNHYKGPAVPYTGPILSHKDSWGKDASSPKNTVQQIAFIYEHKALMRPRNYAIERLIVPASEQLAEHKFCESVTLYRGLSFDDLNFPPELRSILETHIVFDYTASQIRSWTYSADVSQNYAQLANPKAYHVILRGSFKPEDILVDTVAEHRGIKGVKGTGGQLGSPDSMKEVRTRPGVYMVEVMLYIKPGPYPDETLSLPDL
jgi:hypothetical protein